MVIKWAHRPRVHLILQVKDSGTKREFKGQDKWEKSALSCVFLCVLFQFKKGNILVKTINRS